MASRKGISNKNKDFLLKRLQDMYGEDFDPIMMAAKNAKLMQDIVESPETLALEPSDRVELHKKTAETWEKIGQYVNPKLKAIEISGEIDVNPHEAWLEALNGE